jgi:hypothetical protein
MKRRFSVVLVIALIALFLSSCGLTDLSSIAAETPVPTLPPVTDTGAVYKNEDVGLTITYPEDWNVLSNEDIESLYAEAWNTIKEMYKDPSELEKYKEQNIPVSYATLYPSDYREGFNPTINIVIMEGDLGSDIVSFAAQSVKAMKQAASGVLEYGEIQSCKVGGIDAAVADFTIEQMGVKLAEKQYYIYKNQHLIIITLCYINPEALGTMQKAVDNVRFN